MDMTDRLNTGQTLTVETVERWETEQTRKTWVRDDFPEITPFLFCIAQTGGGGPPCLNQFWHVFKIEKVANIACRRGGGIWPIKRERFFFWAVFLRLTRCLRGWGERYVLACTKPLCWEALRTACAGSGLVLLGGGGLRFIIVIIKTVYIIIIITIIMMNNTIVKGALCSWCANEIRSQMEEKRKGRAWKWDRWLLLDLILTTKGGIALRDFFTGPPKKWQSTEKWFCFTTMTSSRNFFSSKKSKKVVDGEIDKSTERKGAFLNGLSWPDFFQTFLEKNAFRPCVM